jgi:putative ABC transport system permease protein
MKELFGIPMETIMFVLLALFGVAVLSVAIIALRSGMMFRMGLRNIPRRGLQTGLVIVGLMLATLITTAAFTTGDTVDHSIAKAGYDQLQRSDLQVNLVGGENAYGNDAPVYVKDSSSAALSQEFAGDEDMEAFLGFLQEPVAAINTNTNLSEPAITLSGIDTNEIAAFGGLTRASGGAADLSKLGPNDVFLTEKAADKLKAKVGDTITIYVNDTTTKLAVTEIVEDELVTSGVRYFYQQSSGGGAVQLETLQRMTGHEGEVNRINVALKGSVATSYLRTDSAVSRLEPFVQSDEGKAVLGITNTPTIDPIKKDSVEEAEESGNIFTTFFLVLGLFSIAAGIMLIFMIFVMLAAERKAEMGMARAVGAQKSSLVQAFISEGMAYSLMAGAVGAALGVAAAVGLVAGFLKLAGGFDFIEARITVTSLVTSYCLGVVITFLTVVISSFKVSSVNIVSAIRDTDDEAPREKRGKISWAWVLGGIPALIIPPLGLWFILRKGLKIAWTWILAPAGILLGLFCIAITASMESEFVFSFGVSIIPLCLAAIASRFRAPARLTWTLVGVYLAAYWLSPVDYGKLIFGESLSSDIEMFMLSGIMVVISFTLIIVYNARLLTTIFEREGDSNYRPTLVLTALAVVSFVAGYLLQGDDGLGQLLYLLGGVVAIGAALAFAAAKFPHLAPALKMGVAYPLSNRFRTGMTIAMFSLIVFSLATFSAINSSFVAMLTADGGDGGWDIMTTANRNTEVTDVKTALASANTSVDDDIAAYGQTTTFDGFSQVTYADETKVFPVIAADDDFLSMPEGKLSSWARGYDDERAVFEAVRGDSKLAIVDPSVLPSGFNIYEFNIDDLEVTDERFDPVQVTYKDPRTGKEATATVVGVLAIQVNSDFTAGVYVNEAAYRAVFGEPNYLRTYVKLDNGVNAGRAAESIESALVTDGVQAESIRELLDQAAQEQNTFMRMFQGFMALGLFTGIAALGVIAFRSVVERRQQIGMLRAIGYQSTTVSLTFMLESGFIALMGILSGVIGGMIIARNLMTSAEFGSGIPFSIPWVELLLMAGAAFVFSMFMTWWPSRQAARVPVADALRYE